MFSVFNTSLLSTCHVRTPDLDVGVVGGIERSPPVAHWGPGDRAERRPVLGQVLVVGMGKGSL